MITYAEFKKKHPTGSTVCSPEGTFCGQCVSLVRTYMKEVHGVDTGPLGNAVDFATNPTFLKYYEKVVSRRVGDIMIWGDDPGTWTDKEGHDAIYDGGERMYNQNYNNSRKVSFNSIFTPGFIGYYRLKETDMLTKEQLSDMRRFQTGKSATKSEIKKYVGNISYADMKKKMKGWASYRGAKARASKGKLNAVKHLPFTLRTLQEKNEKK